MTIYKNNIPDNNIMQTASDSMIKDRYIKPKILLVDDVETNLYAMKKVLSDLVAEIITAKCGEEVLALVLQYEFALILMDVNMPGMSGHETAELLRGNDNTKHIPILFVTGISKDDECIFKGYDVGAVDYLFKPVNTHILKSKVNIFLELYLQRKAVDVVDKLEREIYERQIVEKSLLEKTQALSQSNYELEQFAYVTSHDLHAPLRAIDNLSQWIEEDLKEILTGDSKKHMELLRMRVHRLEKMIDDILQYSRAGKNGIEPEIVDVRKLILEVIEMQDPPEQFVINLGDSMPTFQTSRIAMQQVFTNLIGNAIKHHESNNGCIDITVRETEMFYEFRVSDDGPGIPSEFHEKVFLLFQTLKPRDQVEGTGLGLSLIKKLMERIGGSVQLQSSLGKGATFVIRWPKSTKKKEE